MRSYVNVLIVAVIVLAAVSAVSGQDVDKAEAKRQSIQAMAQEALQDLFRQQPGSRDLFDAAAGYAVFDSIKFSFLISGGGGVGVAVNRHDRQRTFMKMGTGGIGLGLGGQSYQVVFLFEDQKTFRRFVDHGWQADASANAVAGTSGKNADATFTDGLAVYQLTNKGLMAQADISGTKYWKSKKLNRH
jgi:lipid-binding SYLF domain-containing protein